MNEGFLRTMIDQNTIQPTLRIHISAHGPLHPLQNDCEMHVAGTPQNVSIGTPKPVIVEFPNWCQFNPQGNLGDSFTILQNKWATFSSNNLDNQTCDVTGFLRIFTEHASGHESATNLNHVYEYHPALKIQCNQTFSFANMLRAFPDLRHISNGAASTCISGRRLKVRFLHNRYEFTESGGGSCGNFVIIRVSAIDATGPLSLDGGHYAVATVTADGHHTGSIGLYTLSGSPSDAWLSQVIANGGMNHSTKVIHGVFTYNWQSIINSIKKPDGTLRRPNQPIDIKPSLAIVSYGEATAPF